MLVVQVVHERQLCMRAWLFLLRVVRSQLGYSATAGAATLVAEACTTIHCRKGTEVKTDKLGMNVGSSVPTLTAFVWHRAGV